MKLKYKLFLAVFPLLAGLLVGVFTYMNLREQRLRNNQLDAYFTSSFSGLMELFARQDEAIRTSAALVSQDSGWAAIQATSEKEGVSALMATLQRKASLELLVYIGTDGQAREGSWAGNRWTIDDVKEGLVGFFQRNGALRKKSGFLVLQGKLFAAAISPVQVAGMEAYVLVGSQIPLGGLQRANPGLELTVAGFEGQWSGVLAADKKDTLTLTNLSDEIERVQLSGGTSFFARSVKIDPDMPTMRVALLTPAAPFDRIGADLPPLFAACLLFSLLASLALAYMIARSVTAPLELVSRAVRDVSSGGSVATAPSYLTERRDEVGAVATSFNLLARSHSDELKQKEKALMKLEKYQSQLLDLNHRLAKKLYENRVMLMLWREQEKAEDTKDFLSHILEEVLQGLPFHYGCIIIRPLAQIGPEVILARIERQKTGKDEISVTDILERSDRTLWLSSLSPELKEFLLRMNQESATNLRLLQEVLTAKIEPDSPVKSLSVVSLPLKQGEQHMGSMHLITEREKFALNASDEEFLVSVAAQVSVALDNRSLQFATRMDPLTRLYNRGYLNDRLREEMMRTSRTNRPFTLMILDIDHFKKVNDTYGHQAGDEVLVGISALLKRSCRASDAICRYGGEEIALVLVDTPLAGAKTFAENIRKTIETEAFTIPDGKSIKITASMGLAEFPSQAGSMQELIKHADDALYKAKREGRNVWRAFSA